MPSLPSLKKAVVPPPSAQGSSLFLIPSRDPINDELQRANAKRARDGPPEHRSAVMRVTDTTAGLKKTKK